MARDDTHPATEARPLARAVQAALPGAAAAADWFLGWQPGLHASLFLGLHDYLGKTAAGQPDRVVRAHALYLEQTEAEQLDALLSLGRARRLVALIAEGALDLHRCSGCGASFVSPPASRPRAAPARRCGLCTRLAAQDGSPPGRGNTLH